MAKPPSELVTVEPGMVPAVPMTATEQLISKALDKDINPEGLYEILKQERADQRKMGYLEAFQAFQARVKPLVKASSRVVDRDGNQIPYATLGDIRSSVDPLLRELGLSISYGTENVNGTTYSTVKLSHRDGHEETRWLPFKAAKPPGASNEAQAVGSGQTYAMRYLTVAILGLWFVDKDTDGVDPMVEVQSNATIDEHQARTIDALIVRTGQNLATFREYFEITQTAELLVHKYPEAIKGLVAKLPEGVTLNHVLKEVGHG